MVQSRTLISGRKESQRLSGVSLGLVDLALMMDGFKGCSRTLSGEPRKTQGRSERRRMPLSFGQFPGAGDECGPDDQGKNELEPEGGFARLVPENNDGEQSTRPAAQCADQPQGGLRDATAAGLSGAPLVESEQ